MANFARQPCRVIASNCQQQKVLCSLSHLLHQTGLSWHSLPKYLSSEMRQLLCCPRVPAKKITLQRETCMKCRKGRETLTAVAVVLDAFPRPAALPALINVPSSPSACLLLRSLSSPNIHALSSPPYFNSDMGHCFQ